MAREMKDSGIEWIGEIPENWSVKKIKHCFTVFAGATPKSEKNEYWDGDISWITPADYKTEEKYVYTGRKKITMVGYKSCGTTIVPKGSVIFSKRAPVGTVAISGNELCTNQGCLACVPLNMVDSIYYYYAISVFTEQFELVSSGTTFKEISANSFVNFLLPFTIYEEQIKISSFLDKKCAELDNVLEKTRASIGEYKKLKQAVITQAVTKGIRGDREMKDSRVDWIGEIPSEWRIIRIKWVLSERKEKSERGEEESLSMSQKYGIIPTKEMEMIPNMAASFIGAKIVHSGDLVFNKLKAHLGVFAVSKYNGLVSPDYAVYHSKGIADVKYLEYLFKTPQYIAEFRKRSSGVGVGLTRLYTDELYSIYCLLPSWNEQEEIISYLNKKIKEIDNLIEKKEQYLSEIENYKKSMIYEYVTGKKEV